MHDSTNVSEELPRAFDHAADKIKSRLEPCSHIGGTFEHPSLRDSVLIPFRPIDEFNGSSFFDQIELLTQSNDDVDLEDGHGTFNLVTVDLPRGSGLNDECYFNRNKYLTHFDFLHRSHGGCFILIKNRDHLCLARALVTAVSLVQQDNPDYHFNAIRQGGSTLLSFQARRAQRLTELAGLMQHHGPFGIPELKKYQKVLKNYKIKVFSKETYYGLIFNGDATEAKRIIYIYHYDNHYGVISTMPAFFSRVYFCDSCNKAHNDANQHVCTHKCPSCYHKRHTFWSTLIKCDDCNRLFKGKYCFENHKRKYKKKIASTEGKARIRKPTAKKAKNKELSNGFDLSICERFHRCKVCYKQYRPEKIQKHKCGIKKCTLCKKEVEAKSMLNIYCDLTLEILIVYFKIIYATCNLTERWKTVQMTLTKNLTFKVQKILVTMTIFLRKKHESKKLHLKKRKKLCKDSFSSISKRLRKKL